MPGTFVPDPILNPRLSASWAATVATAITELQRGPWIPLPFTSPWTNWATLDPNWQSCEYRKVGNTVQLRGLARRNNSGAAIICQLPVGYRATANIHFPAPADNGYLRVYSDANGYVVCYTMPSADGWVSLARIQWAVP